MGWITRYNQVIALISNGKIPAANKTTLKTLNTETVRRHGMINYWNNVQVAPLAVIADYNSVYTAYQTVMTAALADMTTDYTISDVTAFTDLVERMMFSEGYILFIASEGELAYCHLRVLANTSASGEAGEVAMYLGGIYVYSGGWTRKIVRGYKGSLAAAPADEANAFFIPSQDFAHSSGLYVNGQQLQVNGEELYISRAVKKGEIHYFDSQWLPERDTENYRYAPAVEEYVTLMSGYPDVVDNTKDKAKKNINKNNTTIVNTLDNVAGMITSQTSALGRIGTTVTSASSGTDTLVDDFDFIKDGLEDIIESIGDYIDD